VQGTIGSVVFVVMEGRKKKGFLVNTMMDAPKNVEKLLVGM
jgi:hypothetical protein